MCDRLIRENQAQILGRLVKVEKTGNQSRCVADRLSGGEIKDKLQSKARFAEGIH
jgi:hypothetical protein